MFRPRWLIEYNRKLSKEIKLYIAKRKANSGRPTFALYYTPKYSKGNEGFPIPFTDYIDVPIWAIKEFLEEAVQGAKVLKKLGEYYDDVESIIKAAEIGYEIKRAKNRIDLAFEEDLLAFI